MITTKTLPRLSPLVAGCLFAFSAQNALAGVKTHQCDEVISGSAAITATCNNSSTPTTNRNSYAKGIIYSNEGFLGSLGSGVVENVTINLTKDVAVTTIGNNDDGYAGYGLTKAGGIKAFNDVTINAAQGSTVAVSGDSIGLAVFNATDSITVNNGAAITATTANGGAKAIGVMVSEKDDSYDDALFKIDQNPSITDQINGSAEVNLTSAISATGYSGALTAGAYGVIYAQGAKGSLKLTTSAPIVATTAKGVAKGVVFAGDVKKADFKIGDKITATTTAVTGAYAIGLELTGGTSAGYGNWSVETTADIVADASTAPAATVPTTPPTTPPATVATSGVARGISTTDGNVRPASLKLTIGGNVSSLAKNAGSHAVYAVADNSTVSVNPYKKIKAPTAVKNLGDDERDNPTAGIYLLSENSGSVTVGENAQVNAWGQSSNAIHLASTPSATRSSTASVTIDKSAVVMGGSRSAISINPPGETNGDGVGIYIDGKRNINSATITNRGSIGSYSGRAIWINGFEGADATTVVSVNNHQAGTITGMIDGRVGAGAGAGAGALSTFTLNNQGTWVIQKRTVPSITENSDGSARLPVQNYEKSTMVINAKSGLVINNSGLITIPGNKADKEATIDNQKGSITFNNQAGLINMRDTVATGEYQTLTLKSDESVQWLAGGEIRMDVLLGDSLAKPKIITKSDLIKLIGSTGSNALPQETSTSAHEPTKITVTVDAASVGGVEYKQLIEVNDSLVVESEDNPDGYEITPFILSGHTVYAGGYAYKLRFFGKDSKLPNGESVTCTTATTTPTCGWYLVRSEDSQNVPVMGWAGLAGMAAALAGLAAARRRKAA